MRRVSRRQYTDLSDRYDAQTARLATAREEREKTARAMTTIAVRYDALKTVIARHIVAAEQDGPGIPSAELRTAIAAAGINIRVELHQATAATTTPVEKRAGL